MEKVIAGTERQKPDRSVTLMTNDQEGFAKFALIAQLMPSG